MVKISVRQLEGDTDHLPAVLQALGEHGCRERPSFGGAGGVLQCIHTWMSQEVCKWLVNGLFHLLINGVYWGYKPLIVTFDPNFLGHPSTSISHRFSTHSSAIIDVAKKPIFEKL